MRDGRATFLRPERAGVAKPIPLPRCAFDTPSVGIKPDLNGDGDADDTVVQLWRGGAANVENLHCAASEVLLSDTFVAAAVVDGATHELRTLRLTDPSPTSCADWRSSGAPAEAIAFCGGLVAFRTPEAVAGINLNAATGDADLDDRVLQLFDPVGGSLVNSGHATVDFVCDGDHVAFRSREADEGGVFLNGDADLSDDVLRVYDLTRPGVSDGGESRRLHDRHGRARRPVLSAGLRSARAVRAPRRFHPQGQLVLDTKKPSRLLVPAALGATPPDPATHTVDDFDCYDVKVSKGDPPFPKGLQATVVDDFAQPKTYALRKPSRLCVAADRDGTTPGATSHPDQLLCYRVKLAKTPQRQTKFPQVPNLTVANAVATGRRDAVKPDELCVPSTVTP